MTAKIVLSCSRDIPFNKLILAQSNVRRIKVGVSIEELAEDIAHRTLLQSLTVRPVRDAGGAETGMFEIPAGGRRYRALDLLVRQKRLARTAPVPCVVRDDGIAEEDSLAENVQRAPLHPLDQFRAFLALRETGQSEEEIAAAFFVPVAVVKQRLKLASVSSKLLDVYAEDGMTLEQLMAFTVNADHARQEQVFERLCPSYEKQPYAIRRMLTEGAVRASDKRAQFIGMDAYVDAGGVVLRDLFENDQGGWLQDAGLLDTLVADRLNLAGEEVCAEGWRWVEIAPDFPYGHTYGLRQLRGEVAPLTLDEQATRDALQAEADRLEAAYDADEELPEDADQRMGEIETALAVIDDRPVSYDLDEVARGGAFVSLDGSGRLRIERGYVRVEDEPHEASDLEADGEPASVGQADQSRDHGSAPPAGSSVEPEEDEGLKPIPDRLMTELTSHRTVALRQALGEHPDVAFLGALHALTLRVFYRYAQDTCLELDLKSVGFTSTVPGLADSAAATALSKRHAAWVTTLPDEPGDLWKLLSKFDGDSRQALFAHCVSQSVNAVFEPYNRRPRALAHADRLAQALDLDMVAAGWVPTAETYLVRVTKARILEAVRDAKGDRASARIEHLKKADMAEAAQDLLAGSGWLPDPLRTPGRTPAAATDDAANALLDEAEADVAAHAMAAE